MGGYGSGQNRSWNRKIAVEECAKISIRSVKSVVHQIENQPSSATAILNWSWAGSPPQSAKLILDSDGIFIKAWITYWECQPCENAYHHYQIGLVFSPLPWSSKRWWWTCPECGKRTASLYLPQGYKKFACRSCYGLTYISSRKSRRALSCWDRLNTFFDLERGEYQGWPGSSASSDQNNSQWQGSSRKRLISAEDLCEQSGLSMNKLHELEFVRLLLPDQNGQYRPKLIGWAKKLDYLFETGWTIPEICAWARGRWRQTNPRLWPPVRSDWEQMQDICGPNFETEHL